MCACTATSVTSGGKASAGSAGEEAQSGGNTSLGAANATMPCVLAQRLSSPAVHQMSLPKAPN